MSLELSNKDLIWGGDVNAVNEKGETQLHTAAQNGHTNRIKWLVEKNSNLIERVDNSNWTALEHAVWCGQTKAVSFLLKQVDRDDAFFVRLLSHATATMACGEEEQASVVELLLDNLVPDPNNALANLGNFLEEPLDEVVYHGKYKVAKLLIFSILHKDLTEKKPNSIQENKELSFFWDEQVAKINCFLGDKNTGTNQALKKSCIARVESAPKTLLSLAFFAIPTVNHNVSEVEKTVSNAVPASKLCG